MTKLARSRLEEIAYSWNSQKSILWLAYRYSGDGQEEILYTQGIDFEDRQDQDLYKDLLQILRQDFIPKSALVFPRFLGCSQAYLHENIPVDIRAIMQGFFAEIDVESTVVTPVGWDLTKLTLRWRAPLDLGPDEFVSDDGEVVAALQAGIGE